MPESDVPQKLREWLRGMVAAECVRIEARHTVAGSEGGSTIASFTLEGQPPQFNADGIYEKLASDAEGIGGPQRYTLVAFCEGSKSPRDTLRVRVDGGADPELGGGVSEPANLRGMCSQLMRHNETNMRLLAQIAASVPEAMSKFTRVVT